MQSRQFQVWGVLHKWSSLVSTIFLLMLCITGLPLTFHDEIDEALNPSNWQAKNPDAPLLSLDSILLSALSQRSDETPIYMSFDAERPVINVTSGPVANAPASDMYFASFDATSGDLVPPANNGETVMEFILQLHTDMFLGLNGMYILAFMGLLLIVATVSGVVLYYQFMRRLSFGTLRLNRPKRLRWLDYHNFLGVTTMAWVLVVGLTGIINALEKPILDTWRENNLNQLISEFEGGEIVTPVASLHDAVEKAKLAAPGMTLQFVAFPGSEFSTSRHYAIFLHGNSPFTKELSVPVLVDAVSGELIGKRNMPWYMQALSISRPLHFGDYGGLFLKIIWACLNVMTIIILITGLLLWYRKYLANKKTALERALS